jgi:hypothetical protein
MKTIIAALILFVAGAYVIQAVNTNQLTPQAPLNATESSAQSAAASVASDKTYKASLCPDWKSRDCKYRSYFSMVSPGFEYQVALPYAAQKENGFSFYPIKDLLQVSQNQIPNKTLLFAINADYVDLDATPQGLNSRQGVVTKGLFASTRSSFGLSKPSPAGQVVATIDQGLRQDPNLNYYLVGGNGRFYKDFKFIDICQALGEFACNQSTTRSMVAITDQNYVIFSVYDDSQDPLTPDKFELYFTTIANQNKLGNIRDAMLFDGGKSPAMWYQNSWQLQSLGPIGSAFLIYY